MEGRSPALDDVRRKAAVKGYAIGGKTGTADKLSVRGYRKDARISSFVGAFPIDDPRYILLVMVDEPKGNARTFNYATGGWVAAPAVGHVVQSMAPLLGMSPDRQAAGKKNASPLTRKKPAPPPGKTIIKAKSGARMHEVSGDSESQMLKRVRAVLDPPERNYGPGETGKAGTASTAGSPEQALATY